MNIKFGPKEDGLKTPFQKFMSNALWLVGTARNAILVIATGLITYTLDQSGQNEFLLIGDIPPGLPTIQIPPFSTPDTYNATTNELIRTGESFTEMFQSMGSFLIVIPLIALLENISICKAFGKLNMNKHVYYIHSKMLWMIIPNRQCPYSSANGKSVDATQELLAIGASNVLNSFVSGFPGNYYFCHSPAVLKFASVSIILRKYMQVPARCLGVLSTMLAVYARHSAICTPARWSSWPCSSWRPCSITYRKPHWPPSSSPPSSLWSRWKLSSQCGAVKVRQFKLNSMRCKCDYLDIIEILMDIFRIGFAAGTSHIFRLSYTTHGVWHIDWYRHKYYVYFVSCCSAKDTSWIPVGECSAVESEHKFSNYWFLSFFSIFRRHPLAVNISCWHQIVVWFSRR